jgi:RNA polymerase sigma factor (sigma-70 family)
VTIDSEIVERMAEVGPQSASSINAAAGQLRLGGTFENVGASGNIDTPETLLLRQTLAPDLQAAIDELPEIFRQAVWLRDVEEFSYAEIAEMLSIPVGTVMSRISRARHQLFERLKHERPVNA